MELYQYKAIDSTGRVVRGRLDALNVGDLELRLSRIGLDLVNYKQVSGSLSGVLVAGRGIKRTDLINFCFHLEQLMDAGVPILESLADLRDSIDNPRMREVTSMLIDLIEGGKSLSDAMRDFPYVFSGVFVNLIRAGEESGQLTEVLRNIVENLKWQDEQTAHAKKLLTYPLIVLVLISCVLFFLMLYVVPDLLRFVKMMGQEIPFHTKALIFVSNLFAEYWYILVLLPFVIFAFVYTSIKRSSSFHLKFDDMLLKIPVIGPVLKKLILTRFASYFAIMYSSGITVLECIRVGEQIVGNKAIEQAIRSAGRQIAEGAGISASFASSGLFPPLVLRMLRVGENTGALDKALRNISYFYTREVRESVERLQTMVEPAITAILGLLLGWVMLSILGPIYDLITKINF